VKAMILAAGKGERLRPLTERTPKPLLAVGPSPLIAHQLEWLRDAGVTEVVINLHHLGEQIEAFCGDGRNFGLTVHYSHEDTLLETGGGIVKALPLLGNAPFLVLNGDIYTEFPFSDLPSSPPEWADLHLLLAPTPAYRFHGDFNSEAHRITGRGDDFVYCGIGVLRSKLFADRRIEPFSLQHTLFQAVEQGRASAQIWDGYWIDIGGHDQLQTVNDHLRQR
jgi:MurNAc alpha-1-phosphate uridylyltransferase